MAKAKPRAMSKTKTAATKTAPKRSSGGAGKSAAHAVTRPTATHRPSPRKARAQLPGEKAVRDTDQTVPVKPERAAPGATEPMPAAAVDRRRQIVGSDDPRDRTAS